MVYSKTIVKLCIIPVLFLTAYLLKQSRNVRRNGLHQMVYPQPYHGHFLHRGVSLEQLPGDTISHPKANYPVEWSPPTLPASLHDADQDDPELVTHIRERWLLAPFVGERNLRHPHLEHYSQNNQSQFVDDLLSHKRDGFYFECGAGNGEKLSNSLFFEKSRNWTGLLVEANPYMFQSLLEKRRHAYFVNACLSPTTKPGIMPFKLAGMLGGLVHYMDHTQKDRVRTRKASVSETVNIQCFPLYSILSAINVTYIDYMSLDIEGAELDVLYTLPLDTITVDVFSIEYVIFNNRNATKEKLEAIKQYLVTHHGYRVERVGHGQDVILKKY